jgi:hypothetical protein
MFHFDAVILVLPNRGSKETPSIQNTFVIPWLREFDCGFHALFCARAKPIVITANETMTSADPATANARGTAP